MEFVIISGIIFAILTIFALSNTPKRQTTPQFKYFKKNKIMTDREEIFFQKLQAVCGPNILIFPQIHLSAIFSHYIKGQNFRHAFKFINSHSVDFVLCDPRNLRPLLAIELDDKTHNSPDRQKRDQKINTIFQNSKLPLLRFNSVKIENDKLKAQIVEALKKTLL